MTRSTDAGGARRAAPSAGSVDSRSVQAAPEAAERGKDSNKRVVEVVRRAAAERGFVVVARRWGGERTFAWLKRCRRLEMDFERLAATVVAFIYAALVRLLLNRLAPPFMISLSMGAPDFEGPRRTAPSAFP